MALKTDQGREKQTKKVCKTEKQKTTGGGFTRQTCFPSTEITSTNVTRSLESIGEGMSTRRGRQIPQPEHTPMSRLRHGFNRQAHQVYFPLSIRLLNAPPASYL